MTPTPVRQDSKWLTVCLSLMVAAMPLAILPWWSLYFDVVPKVVLVLLSATFVLLNFRHFETALSDGLRSRTGKLMGVCFALQLFSLLASSAFSANPMLSLFGSGWRRLGAIEYLALLLLAFFVGLHFVQDKSRLRLLLRALSVSGLVLSTYGILQYAGWDPVLSPKSYQAMNGDLLMIRPPATLGHATYFGNYLGFLILVLAGMAIHERCREWRVVAIVAMVLGTVALFLTGTRSALLSVAAGGLFLLVRLSGRIISRRSILIGLAAMAIGLGALLMTPAGQHIRERWRLDPSGGPRMLVWRDSLGMAQSYWRLGAGPEMFASVFPRFQSLPLAKAYPDWYHESPHNFLLDVLLSQGIPGLLVLLVTCFFAIRGSFRWSAEQPIAIALAAALIALAVSQQFAVFILPNALAFYLTAAILAAGADDHAPGEPVPSFAIGGLRRLSLPLAVLLGMVGAQICYLDFRWAGIHRAILTRRPDEAVKQYESVQKFLPPETGAALWYSRAVLDSTISSADPALRRVAWTQALDAAAWEAEYSEDQTNARYNLAVLLSSQADPSRAEAAGRAAIESAPRWYKPHWLLAEILLNNSRVDDAGKEAQLAITLGGPRPELAELIRRIQQHGR